MKLYSAEYAYWYPFDEFYPKAAKVGAEKPDDLKPDGWLILWGGRDIHPALYNHKDVGSNVGPKPCFRDRLELSLFKRAVEIGLPIIGVCRGAQMGCIGSGGTLIQDVTGHQGAHLMDTRDGMRIPTTSVHHQMLHLDGTEHELIAWSAPRLSRHYWHAEEQIDALTFKEPEIVWFPKTKCLGIQGHPEYCDPNVPMNRYLRKLMYGIVK